MGRMEVEAWGWLNGYRSIEENRCTNLRGLAETSRWLKVTPRLPGEARRRLDPKTALCRQALGCAPVTESARSACGSASLLPGLVGPLVRLCRCTWHKHHTTAIRTTLRSWILENKHDNKPSGLKVWFHSSWQ